MKYKIIKISLIFLIFLAFLVLHLHQDKISYFKILKAIEADEFYIDFNENNRIDNDEHVLLKGVHAYKNLKEYDTQKIANSLGITLEQYLKAGYLAKNWSKNILEGETVGVSSRRNCFKDEFCELDIYFNGENLAKFLVKNGMAYPSRFGNGKLYFQYLNVSQTKNLANLLNDIDYVFVNLKNNVIHKINCEQAKTLTSSELRANSDINLKSGIYCKKCFDIKLDKLIKSIEIPKAKGVYNKSFHKKIKNMDLYFLNPLERKGPNSLCENDFCHRLLDEIKMTQKTIDIAIYHFGEQKEIFDALIEAKNRGVKIRLILDKSNSNFENSMYDKSLIKEFDAILDSNNSLMHNKFFIFDNKIVMSGSLNISSTGSGGYNSNLAIFINDFDIANHYTQEFNQMFTSRFSKNKHKIKPNNNEEIKIYFSPQDDIYNSIIKALILNSLKEIYISAFYLTNREMIEDLIVASKRGVTVNVILDAVSANNFSKYVYKLRENNVNVIVENWGGKNHEKTMVIDDDILIFGSCNFSKSGFYKNDENVLFIQNKELVSIYKDYFLYLFSSIDKKYLISIPKAEGFESKNSCFDGIDNDYDGKIDSEDEGCKL